MVAAVISPVRMEETPIRKMNNMTPTFRVVLRFPPTSHFGSPDGRGTSPLQVRSSDEATTVKRAPETLRETCGAYVADLHGVSRAVRPLSAKASN